MHDLHIRHAIPSRDIPAMVRIDQESFTGPWTAKDFRVTLQSRDHVGMVAELCGANVVGYVIYELFPTEMQIIAIVTDPRHLRQGIGREMVESLKRKLNRLRRKNLTLAVRESNLEAQLFFRACGLQAVNVSRGYYADTGEDAYRFVYTCGQTAKAERQGV